MDQDNPVRGAGKRVGAAVATLAIIRKLCRADRPLRLLEIADPLELNRSTALNILRTLVDEGLVAFDPAAKSYGMTEEIGVLAEAAGYREGAASRALIGQMEMLARRHMVNVAYWAVQGRRLVLRTIAESPSDIRITQSLGQRVPLLQGAVGRVVAAASDMPDSDIAALFAATQFRTEQSLERLLHEVHGARRRGWADDGGMSPPGTRALAVPILSAGGAVQGACAALMMSGQHSAASRAAIVQDLIALAGVRL